MTNQERIYLTELVNKYSSKVYSFCVRICIDKSDAEDLYQDVFLTLSQNAAKIKREENVLSYIYKICVLRYKNTKRKYARRNRIAPVVYSDDENAPELPSGENIEKAYIKKELHEKVCKTVSQLDDKYKIPVVLHYARDMSVAEISKILSVPQGTVKSRLFTARKIIAKELEMSGFDGQEY